MIKHNKDNLDMHRWFSVLCLLIMIDFSRPLLHNFDIPPPNMGGLFSTDLSVPPPLVNNLMPSGDSDQRIPSDGGEFENKDKDNRKQDKEKDDGKDGDRRKDRDHRNSSRDKENKDKDYRDRRERDYRSRDRDYREKDREYRGRDRDREHDRDRDRDFRFRDGRNDRGIDRDTRGENILVYFFFQGLIIFQEN